MNKNSAALAEFVRVKRIKAGLSQVDVARKLGYKTSQFVSNWERGLSTPPISTLKKLGQLYKTNPEELFDALLLQSRFNLEKKLRRSFFGNKAKK